MAYFFNTGQLDSSLSYLEKAKAISAKSGSAKHQVNSLLNAAMVIREKGSFEKSMEDYFEALKLAEGLQNQRLIGSAYSGIAVVYSFQKDQVKAREYYKKALDIFTALGDEKKLASLNNNIGLSYMDDKDFKTALKYMLVALNLNKKYNNSNGTAAAAENIGLIYDQFKDYKLAMTYYTQALEIWRSRKDVYSIGINLSYMALTFNNMGQYSRARDTAVKALDMAKSVGAINTQIDLHRYLSETYTHLKDFEKSLDHYKQSRELTDSLRSEENIKSFTETQLKYSFYKQQLKDSLSYILKVNQKEEQLKAEKTVKYIAFAAIAVFALLLFFLLKAFREKQNANRIVLVQKELVELKQKEIIDSLNYAKRIQTALLAGGKLLKDNLKEHFILFKPKDIVAGDFYWAANVVENSLKAQKENNLNNSEQPLNELSSLNKNELFYLAVCDSTGHGVPGAFMSLLSMGFLREAINERNILEPHLVFEYVRQRLINDVNDEGQKDGFDGILLCINKSTHKITYAAANNAPVVVKIKAGDDVKHLTELQKDHLPVGESEKKKPFSLFSLDYNPGDVLFLYTDGYADQFGGPNGKKFKYKQLNETLKEIAHLPMDKQQALLAEKFYSWKGDLEQIDDVCIVGIKL